MINGIRRAWAFIKNHEFLYPVFLSLPVLIKFGLLDVVSLGTDTRTHVYKTYVLIQEIKQLPPSLWGLWDWNWFCGYPFLKLYAPLFYYVSAVFSIAFNVTPEFVAYWIILLSYPFSAMAMYFLAKHLTKDLWASLLASAAYLYIPFHLANGVVFGNPSSLLTFVFMPLALLFAEKFVQTSYNHFAILASFALTGTLLTNHAYGIFFFVLFLIWFLLRRKMFQALTLVSIATLLSAFFLIPILFYSSVANTFQPVYLQFDLLTSIIAIVQPAGTAMGITLFIFAAVLSWMKFKSYSRNRKNSKKLSFKVNPILRVCGVVILLVFIYNVIIFAFPVWPFSSIATGRTVPPAMVFLSILLALGFLATVKENKKRIALTFVLLFVLEGLVTPLIFISEGFVYYPLPPSRYQGAYQFLNRDNDWFRVIFLPSEPIGALTPQYAGKPVVEGWFIQGFSPELYNAWVFFNNNLLNNTDEALILARYLGVKYIAIDYQDPIPGLDYSKALYKAMKSASMAKEVYTDYNVAVFRISGYKSIIASNKVQVVSELEQAYKIINDNSIFVVNGSGSGISALSDTDGEANVTVHFIRQGVENFTVDLSLNGSSYVLIPVSYAPNIQVRVNKEEKVPLKVVPNFICLLLPRAGVYQIEISIKNTLVDAYSLLVSLVTLGGLAVFLLLSPGITPLKSLFPRKNNASTPTEAKKAITNVNSDLFVVLDSTKIRRLLGWKPTLTLKEGLKKVVEMWRER